MESMVLMQEYTDPSGDSVAWFMRENKAEWFVAEILGGSQIGCATLAAFDNAAGAEEEYQSRVDEWKLVAERNARS